MSVKSTKKHNSVLQLDWDSVEVVNGTCTWSEYRLLAKNKKNKKINRQAQNITVGSILKINLH